MKGALDIFRFLLDARSREERSALITLTDIVGSSARAAGSHMAVSESGSYLGSFTGGCIEAALVGEALRVISAGAPELMRFGQGSRFIDIRLPCGGSIDLMIIPLPAEEPLFEAKQLLERRQPVRLGMNLSGGLSLASASLAGGWHGSTFVAVHEPALRLIILGQGVETLSLARLAHLYGAELVVLCPQRSIVDALKQEGICAHVLTTPARSSHLEVDRLTGVVALFHDHDWERELLTQAAEHRPLFVGAMGSMQTQEARIAMLRGNGMEEALARTIVGPIGLISSARDPDTLALSVLGQVVDRYNRVVGAGQEHPS